LSAPELFDAELTAPSRSHILTPHIEALRSNGYTYPATIIVGSTLVSASLIARIAYRLGRSSATAAIRHQEVLASQHQDLVAIRNGFQDLRLALHKKDGSAAALETDVKALKHGFNELRLAVAAQPNVTPDLGLLKSRVQELHKRMDVSPVSGQLVALKSEIHTLQELIARRDTAMTAVEKELTALKGGTAELDGDIKSGSRTLSAVQNSLSSITSDIKYLRTAQETAGDVRQDIASLNEQCSKLHANVVDWRQEAMAALAEYLAPAKAESTKSQLTQPSEGGSATDAATPSPPPTAAGEQGQSPNSSSSAEDLTATNNDAIKLDSPVQAAFGSRSATGTSGQNAVENAEGRPHRSTTRSHRAAENATDDTANHQEPACEAGEQSIIGTLYRRGFGKALAYRFV
jgi:predicted  nucleic acid-binding Zn-ribbon protein